MLLDVPVPVEVLVLVPVDVLLVDEVLVPVELSVAVAEVVAPLVVAEAEDVDVAVKLPEAVVVDVPVEVAVAVAVEVDVAVPVELAIATPVRSSTSQRNVVAVSDTEIIDSMSPASPNVALTSGTELSPFSAVTTASPPPSVFIRRTNRIPGLVGLARTRVSFEAPVVSSQTCKSALGVMTLPSPGSARSFGPLYRSWEIL